MARVTTRSGYCADHLVARKESNLVALFRYPLGQVSVNRSPDSLHPCVIPLKHLCYPSRRRRSPLLVTTVAVTQTCPSSSQAWKRDQNPNINFFPHSKRSGKLCGTTERLVFHKIYPSVITHLYYHHSIIPYLRKSTTILETLEWHYGRVGARLSDEKRVVFDSVLKLSLSKFTKIAGYFQSFDADTLRTFLLFRGSIFESDDIYEEDWGGLGDGLSWPG